MGICRWKPKRAGAAFTSRQQLQLCHRQPLSYRDGSWTTWTHTHTESHTHRVTHTHLTTCRGTAHNKQAAPRRPNSATRESVCENTFVISLPNHACLSSFSPSPAQCSEGQPPAQTHREHTHKLFCFITRTGTAARHNSNLPPFLNTSPQTKPQMQAIPATETGPGLQALSLAGSWNVDCHPNHAFSQKMNQQ